MVEKNILSTGYQLQTKTLLYVQENVHVQEIQDNQLKSTAPIKVALIIMTQISVNLFVITVILQNRIWLQSAPVAYLDMITITVNLFVTIAALNIMNVQLNVIGK